LISLLRHAAAFGAASRAFLLSEHAATITGQEIFIRGGATLHLRGVAVAAPVIRFSASA
jgi:hypothetical protein